MGAVLMAISPYTVNPIYAAMAAATLDELFPGRVQLCFGMGAPRELEAAGIVAEHPVRTLRGAFSVARSVRTGCSATMPAASGSRGAPMPKQSWDPAPDQPMNVKREKTDGK